MASINLPRRVWVPGPVIVGAGPSGLATAACLKHRGVPSLILERESSIASSWKLKMYDGLKLHLPRQFCELPMMPLPGDFPAYPTKHQFIGYLDAYVRRFSIRPLFGAAVRCAEYDPAAGFWRVLIVGVEVEVMCRWLVVATGENSEVVLPELEGSSEFRGRLVHTSSYKSAGDFEGQKVLVVGCGNSGMEVSLDLCNHGVVTSMVVRHELHVLPKEMLGTSSFGLSTWLLKWLPIAAVDAVLLLLSRMILGDTERYGLRRPTAGPLQHKNITGKTPVLDPGTFAKIKGGQLKILPGIQRLTVDGVEFVDGRHEAFDSIVLATGYRSNVPSWLKEGEFFSEKDGLPRKAFPQSWKGEKGLYAAGFTRRGLMGASMEARWIAEDIACQWRSSNPKNFSDQCPCTASSL